MSKIRTQTKANSSLQPTTLTNDQLSIISIQIESIARYFRTRIFDDSVSNAIQERVCKLAKVKHLAKLTQTRYNNTMHYLKNMERIMYQYYWCISLIENNLLNDLLAREIDNTGVAYDTNKLNIEGFHLTRIKKLSQELINLKILKELY